MFKKIFFIDYAWEFFWKITCRKPHFCNYDPKDHIIGLSSLESDKSARK